MEINDTAWRRRFRRRVTTWFRQQARDLPWRRTKDPYHVWVSEIMLQQTQVATVVPYFETFVVTFPTIESLAKAPEQDVLRRWEGLGYYRRARQMHRAARRIVDQGNGSFPRDLEEVMSLPGIGRYTAGAILSIAFGARLPILEANTIRLFSRLLCFRGDPRSADGQQRLWQFAEDILPRKGVGDFNQALMELGSMVCTPRDPDCSRCPAQPLCPTHAGNLQSEIPFTRPRTKHTSVREACVVVRNGSRVLLRKCTPSERWAGMWDFPRFQLLDTAANPSDRTLARELAEHVKRLTGVTITPGPHLTTIKHGVTRYRITLECYSGEFRRGFLKSDQTRWVEAADLFRYPLSVTGRQIADGFESMGVSETPPTES